MILDKLGQLGAMQQFTATGFAASTYDTGAIAPRRRVAVGRKLGILFALKALGTTTGSLLLEAVQDDNPILAGAPEVIGALAVPAAEVKVGRAFVVALSNGIPAKQYIGARATVTGTVDATMDIFFGEIDELSAMQEHYNNAYTP